MARRRGQGVCSSKQPPHSYHLFQAAHFRNNVCSVVAVYRFHAATVEGASVGLIAAVWWVLRPLTNSRACAVDSAREPVETV